MAADYKRVSRLLRSSRQKAKATGTRMGKREIQTLLL